MVPSIREPLRPFPYSLHLASYNFLSYPYNEKKEFNKDGQDSQDGRKKGLYI